MDCLRFAQAIPKWSQEPKSLLASLAAFLFTRLSKQACFAVNNGLPSLRSGDPKMGPRTKIPARFARSFFIYPLKQASLLRGQQWIAFASLRRSQNGAKDQNPCSLRSQLFYLPA